MIPFFFDGRGSSGLTFSELNIFVRTFYPVLLRFFLSKKETEEVALAGFFLQRGNISIYGR
jgi:hypothetical protein